MKYVLITDTHFGCRNGSVTWLNSQMKFMNEQFLPFLSQAPVDGLIVLGDTFDVRHAVQTNIAFKVKSLFKEIATHCPVYILAGNHDFYSPTTDKYCAIDLLLNDVPGVTTIVRNLYNIQNTHLWCAPWYITEASDISTITEELYKQDPQAYLFCHMDLTLAKTSPRVPVFSGHIHGPFTLFGGEHNSIHNLGSCFPLTFADTSARYFYELNIDDNGYELTKHENTTSIKFHRYYTIDDFKNEAPSPGDYIELYIGQISQEEQVWLDRTQKIYQNLTIYKNIITESCNSQIDLSQNMESVVENLVPAEYKEVFQTIKNRL